MKIVYTLLTCLLSCICYGGTIITSNGDSKNLTACDNYITIEYRKSSKRATIDIGDNQSWYFKDFEKSNKQKLFNSETQLLNHMDLLNWELICIIPESGNSWKYPKMIFKRGEQSVAQANP